MYKTRSEKNYLWIFFTMFTIGLGQSLVFTSIPIFAREQGLNEVEVSLVFGVSAFAWFFMSPLWGRYSDKFGTRTVALIGSLGYSANMFLIILPIFLFDRGFITSAALLPSLIACRMVYGIFGSATRPALFGYAGRISSSKNRTTIFANLESGFVLGTILGPIIGAFFFRFANNEIPFILFSMLGLLAALQLNIRLRNLESTKAVLSKPKRLKIGDQKVWPFVVLSSFMSITQAIIFQTLGFYIFDKLDYSAQDAAVYVSISFGIYSTSIVITQTFITPLFKSLKTMMLLGPVLAFLSFIALIYINDIFSLIGALILNGIGFAIVRPSYASALSQSHDESFQSSAAGLLGSTYPIGHMIAPLFVSLYVYGYFYLYSLSAIVCVITVAFTMFHPYILKTNEYR